jgi:site-specific recombinase XerD
MSKHNFGVRISSSAQLKPAAVAGFIKTKKNSVSSVSKVSQYRKPVIVRSKSGWYIKYYYRIPIAVRKFYNEKEWYRFRVKEDMNRRSGEEREQYAEWLRSEIEESLIKGYNPFEPEQEYLNKEEIKDVSNEIGAKDAILLFLEAWRKRGLEPASMIKYERTANRLITWLEKKNIPYRDIKEITQNNIEQFLNELKKEKGFSNREFNNTYDFTRTIFNFLVKKKYISESPCAGIDKLKSTSKKHRFFDEKNLIEIKKAMAADPYLDFACDTVYYLCIRSEKELMNLKVGNILWSQNKILADVTKGKSDRYIPMDENIKEILLKRGIDKFPSDYYVFGIDGKPAKNHFGNGFFSKRFRKIRDAAGLDSNFTIYGWKHTRVIHLKQDGASDSDIMSLTGHKDFAAYAKYLRDIGLDADATKINKLSRKI